jgi:hypothetical protein
MMPMKPRANFFSRLGKVGDDESLGKIRELLGE